MSSTEIFVFTKKGKAKRFAETRNGARSALYCWQALERKYLPSLPIPEYLFFKDDYYSRVCSIEDNAMRPIWELYKDDRLSEKEKIVLCTTFDNVIVKKENLLKVIEAFSSFGNEHPNSSFKEQANILNDVLHSKHIAVGWNQTSVNDDTWVNLGVRKKNRAKAYNLFEKQKQLVKHWYLFDHI